MRHAAAHGEAASESGGKVGGSEGEEFLVRIQPPAMLRGEGAADGSRLHRGEQEAHDVAVQVMENGGRQMEDNHSFKLIGAEAGATRFQVETTFPGVPMIALGMLLLIIGAIMSRGP